MSVFKPVIEDIDQLDVSQLVEDEEREGVAVEFKRDMYGNSDSNRKEFLKDISSFANSSGGHLIIGVDETEGAAVSITPIAGNPDEVLQRLEQMVRSGIEPRIVGVQMCAVPIESGGFVYIIRVPKSWNPPHRVSFQNTSRFYLRSSAGAHEASVEELRAVFANGADMHDRMSAYIKERIDKITNNDGVVPLEQGEGKEGRLVLHVIPFSAFSSSLSIDVAAAQNLSYLLQPLGSSGNPRINFDGFMNVRHARLPHGYTQVFRSGIIEATKVRLASAHDLGWRIPCRSLVEPIFQRLPSYVSALRSLGVAPPLGVSISLIDVQGNYLGAENGIWTFDNQNVIDRHSLILPMQIIADFGSDADYIAALRPALDALWNSVGLPSADQFLANYNDNGEWIGR